MDREQVKQNACRMNHQSIDDGGTDLQTEPIAVLNKQGAIYRLIFQKLYRVFSVK